MKTNYEWKKLIRGGTLLLFFLAFLLSGPQFAIAQDKAPQVLELVIVGDGSVKIAHTDGGSSVGTYGASADPTLEGGAIYDVFAQPEGNMYVRSVEFGGGITATGFDQQTLAGILSTTFTMPNAPGSVMTVTFAQKKVDVTVVIADKVYDGETDATVTGTISAQFIPHGTLTSTLGVATRAVASGPASANNGYVQINWGEVIGADYDFYMASVGTHSITWAGTGITLVDYSPLKGAANYDLSVHIPALATISQRTVNAGHLAVFADDKEYDGTTDATGTVSFTNKVSGDDVTIIFDEAEFVAEAVDTGVAVNFTDLELAGADAFNYNLTAVNTTGTASITVKTLELVNVEVQNVVFPASVTTVTKVTLAGMVAGDEDDVTLGTISGTMFVDGEGNPFVNPGTATVTFDLVSPTLTGPKAGNYYLPEAGMTALAQKGEVLVPGHARFYPSVQHVGAGVVTQVYNVQTNTELKVYFDRDVFSAGGVALRTLPLSGLADYFDLIRDPGGDDEEIEIRVVGALKGGMAEFTIVPLDAQGEVTRLAAGERYVLEYNPAIYYKDADEALQLVEWSLATTQKDGNWVFDTGLGISYYDYNGTVFITADQPRVMPFGLVADVCDVEFKIEFINPIRFQSGPLIEEDVTDKFIVMKREPLGDYEAVDFKASPANFRDADGNPATAGEAGVGPTTIEFTLLPQPTVMDNNMEYKVIILPNANGTFGFWDITGDVAILNAGATAALNTLIPGATPVNVLTEWEHQDGAPGVWEWETAPAEFDIRLAVDGVNAVPYDVWFGDAFNKIDASAANISTAVVSTTASVFVGLNTPSFIIDAVPAEGQKLLRWYLNGVHAAALGANHTVTIDSTIGPIGDEIDDCAVETLTYTAVFGPQKYQFEVDLDTDKGTMYGHALGTATKTHGTHVSFTIEPKRGWILTGYVDNLPAIGTRTYTGADFNDEFDRSATTIEFKLVGSNLVDGASYVVTPTFAPYLPNLYAQTIGPDGTIGVATMSFSIVNTENLNSWDDQVLAPYGSFKRWNVNPGADVTLTALPVPDCEVAFAEWMVYDHEESEWVSYSKNEHIALKMETSLVLRAVYGQESVLVNAISPELNGAKLGLIVFNYMDDGEVATWNSTAKPDGEMIEIGTTVTVTVYPISRYTTYGWQDADGPMIDRAGVEIATRTASFDQWNHFITGEDRRSDWRFNVAGCDPIEIHPVIMPQRVDVTVTVVDETTGDLYVGGTIAGNEYQPEVWTNFGGPGLRYSKGVYYNYDPALRDAADVVTATFEGGIAANAYAAGRIPYNSVLDLTATAAEGYVFLGWFVNGEEITGDIIVTEAMDIEARFEEDLPTYALDATAVPEGAGTFEYRVDGGSWRALDAEGAEIGIAATETRTVEVRATAAAGYKLTAWTVTGAEEIVSDLDVLIVEFVMGPADVSLVAAFEGTTHDIEVIALGYEFGPDGTVTDFRNVDYAGAVTADVEEAVYGETVVNLTATASPGFRFVNWMFAHNNVDMSDMETVEVLGYQIPNGLEPNVEYMIPALAPGTDIQLVAIFAEVGDDDDEFYPAYELTFAVEGHPLPLPEDFIGYEGVYAHGVFPYVFVDDANSAAGYTFQGWQFTPVGAGVLTGTSDPTHTSGYPSLDDSYLFTAIYAAESYELVINQVPVAPTFGHISIDAATTTAGVLTAAYSMDDEPLVLKAEPKAAIPGVTYHFLGWYLDADGEEPLMIGGEHMTDQVWEWTPAVPELGGGFVLYAHFEQVLTQLTVTLKTALGSYDNLFEIAEVALQGAGTYYFNEEARIAAPLVAGDYEFVRWARVDGTTIGSGNSFRHVVKDNVTFVAVYETDEIPTSSVTLAINPGDADASVTGAGTYNVGTEVTVTATANAPWVFLNWTDASGAEVSTSAAYTFTIGMDNVALTANFEDPTVDIVDVEEMTLTLFPNPANSVLNIRANMEITEVRMIDMLGQVVYNAQVKGTEHEISVYEYNTGVYFVQVLTNRGVITERVQITR